MKCILRSYGFQCRSSFYRNNSNKWGFGKDFRHGKENDEIQEVLSR